MTLTLVAAPGGTIEQRASGLVVARAEDFLGPARATLTTAADAGSVSGTVAVETQALVVPSTLTGAGTGARMVDRFPLASDTLRIPVATLLPMLGAETSFEAMISLKVSGDVPSNARYKKTHAFFDQVKNGAAASMAWARDTTLIGGVNIQTELYGSQFLISAPLEIFWSSISGNTDLVLRVWGVTGGTLSYSLDLVYLMPTRGTYRLKHFLSSYPVFLPLSNGGISVDQDNDDTDNVIGKFSVGDVNHVAASQTIGFGAPTDFQEADDEPTVYDISDGSWAGPDPTPLDPKSRMVFMASPQYIPEIQLIDEPFASIAPTANLLVVSAPDDYIISDAIASIGGPGHSSGFNGWTGNNISELYCYLASSASQPGSTYGATFPRATLYAGVSELVSGLSTDPRNYTHRLLGLEDFTCETTWACDTSSGKVSSLIGFQVYSGNDIPSGANLDPVRGGYGVWFVLDSGTLTVSLAAVADAGFVSPITIANLVYEFVTPTTLTAAYAAGDTYRVKVERRRYRLRAKVWEDGTAEPGAWTFDEYMPFFWDESGGAGFGFIDYPYDTGWAGNAAHDVVVDDIWRSNQQSVPLYMASPNSAASSPEQAVIATDYQLWIEPAGASVIDMLVAEENYDGTSRSNNVTLPYSTIPSARMVEGSLRKRHFGGDTNGFNLLAWKDGGAGPEMQSSALPYAWELAVRRRRPQIYRRLYG